MQKKPFKIQDHFVMSEQIRAARDIYQNQYISASKCYPLDSKIVRQSKEIYEKIRLAISELDNLIFRDHPGISDKAAGIYYPGQNVGFDEAQAKEIAANLETDSSFGELLGEKDEAIQRNLIEALKKYSVEAVRQGFFLYSKNITNEMACTDGK